MAKRGYTVRVVQLGEALEGLSFADIRRSQFTPVASAETPATLSDAVAVLDELSPNDLILAPLPTMAPYLRFLREVGRRHLRYVFVTLGALPIRATWRQAIRRDKWRACTLLLASFVHLAYRVKIHLRLLLEMGLPYFRVPGPVLWARTGSFREAFATDGLPYWRPNAVELESFDVAWARNSATNPDDLPPGRFAIYVDEAMCDHPDYAIDGLPVPTGPDAFFPALKAFFDRVEEELGLEVIVALHPKSNYQPSELPRLFGQRRTYSGKTPGLIRRSELVFLHNSTSLSYAVLFRKPTMFLTSHDIDRSWLRCDLDVRSDWLGQPVVNIDDIGITQSADIPSRSVDEKSYADFEDSFLHTAHATSGDPIQIVATRFEALST